MELDLEHILDATRKGQWSVHEFDWDTPLEGVAGKSEKELRQMAQMIVFTAGLERQAAKIFDACARFVTDKTAKQIYELFAIDEIRHAEAELRMAARYGVGWKDLPLPTRVMFKQMEKNWERPNRMLHEFTSAQIILFEIGLDALLIPALKEIDDPLQKEVFRRIDVDESRHLAMDYWLLERKANGVDVAARKPDLRDYSIMLRMIVFAPVGFMTNAFTARDMQRRMATPERMKNYWNRVGNVVKRAPSAMKLPAYRGGVEMQRRIQKMMGWTASLGNDAEKVMAEGETAQA